MSESRAILLMGATGLVGGLLLRRLAEEYPGRNIYALVRAAAAIPESIETIIHCAASTKLNLPLAVSRRVNVRGTANIVQLARRSRRLKILLHISSTHIAGSRPGDLPEEPLTAPDG